MTIGEFLQTIRGVRLEDIEIYASDSTGWNERTNGHTTDKKVLNQKVHDFTVQAHEDLRVTCTVYTW